jgi:hypothetical protein
MVGGKISLDDESIPHTHIHLHKHGKHAHKHGLE